MIIYAITNTLNGQRYIGLTADRPAKRWSAHKTDARRGSQKKIHRAMRACGIESFRFDILANLVPGLGHDDLKALERQMIAQEGTFTRGYNRTEGGDGHPIGIPSPKRGKPMSDAQREKLRQAWARNPQRRLAQALANRLRGQSAAARAKLSASHRRPELVQSLRARNARMNGTPEHFAKVMAGWTPEARERAAAAQRAANERKAANG